MKISLSLSAMLLATTALLAPQTAFAQTEGSETEVEELVVRGRYIPDVMRETAEVATILTADDLQRQGDDTAAEALTRLSGLSVVGGRFVYVRGLGERYSSALLNGSPLPSPTISRPAAVSSLTFWSTRIAADCAIPSTRSEILFIAFPIGTYD